MKIHKKILLIISSLLFLSLFLFTTKTLASTIPTLSIGYVDSSNVRMTVNGDPHSSVELHYGPGAVATNIIGNTDNSGNFTTLLGNQSYDLSQCNQTAYVIVDGSQSLTIPWSSSGNSNLCSSNSSSNLSFSQNNIVLNPGQNFSVMVIGTGGYSISSNSNSNIISASVNGNQINLYASTFGGSNITVCGSDGSCGVLYVVAVNGNVAQTSHVNIPAAISSFTVSSNDATGYFMGGGNILTFTFGANEQIGNVSATVGGSHIGITGSGNGPYTGTYTLSGNETLPIPVVINFADLDDRYSQTTFFLGGLSDSSLSNTASAQSSVTTATVAPVSTPVVSTTPVVSGYFFSKLLTLGTSNGDVTQLQKLLTKLGFYSAPVTGYFGTYTQTAVKKFQKAHGLSQVGYVGPSTRTALNKL